MTGEPDEVFPLDLKSRNANAWARTYDVYVSDVYQFVVHLLGRNRHDAAELHQETWLAALNDIDQFDPRIGEFRPWIFGIARRKVALYYRRRSSKHKIATGSESALDSDNHSCGILPPDVVENAERVDAVQAALAELGGEAKSLLLGKYVNGQSVKQLAEQFGRSPKAIESSLTRARDRLRRLLHWYFDNETSKVR
jgi:RNA polymerase sigma factor (sigma-70 family)